MLILDLSCPRLRYGCSVRADFVEGTEMALRFFYRRQKLVFIIMVVLMVSFLVGFQGFQAIFSTRGGREVVGRTAWGKIRVSDGQAAQADLQLLGMLPADPRRPDHIEASLLLRQLYEESEGQPALAYALLLNEAEQANLRVTTRDVDSFLASRGFVGETAQVLLTRLKQIDQNLTEKYIRGAVARWLMVYKNYAIATEPGVPSASELVHDYRDLYETVKLRVARLRAEDFIARIKEDEKKAMAEQSVVEAWLKEYSDRNPGRFQEGSKVSEDFGFGYRRPEGQVDVVYATVKRAVFRDLLAASDEDEPDSRRAALVGAKMDALVKTASALAAQYAKLEAPPEDMLEYYRAEGVVRPCEDLLDETIGNVYPGRAVPLRQAADMLAKACPKVTKIILPEDIPSLDLSVEVEPSYTGIKLREALDKLIAEGVDRTYEKMRSTTRPAGEKPPPAKKPKPPKWQWVTVKALEGVLLPAGGDAGLASLPIEGPRRTGLADRARLYANHPMLAYSTTKAGQRFDEVAFAADKLTETGSLIAVGQAGENLISAEGVIAWRLVDALPPGEPKGLNDELREQIASDLQTKRAFELAVEYAERLKAKAEKDDKGLRAVAEDDELVAKLFESEPLARKAGLAQWNVIYDPDEVAPTEAEISRAKTEQFSRMLGEILRQQTEGQDLEKQIEDIKKALEESTPRIRQDLWQQKLMMLLSSMSLDHRGQIMAAAFALAPEKVEPPYPDKPVRVRVIAIAPSREVLVVERIGYEPPARDEYAAVRARLAMRLRSSDRIEASVAFFKLENIKKRTGYQPEKR